MKRPKSDRDGLIAHSVPTYGFEYRGPSSLMTGGGRVPIARAERDMHKWNVEAVFIQPDGSLGREVSRRQLLYNSYANCCKVRFAPHAVEFSPAACFFTVHSHGKAHTEIIPSYVSLTDSVVHSAGTEIGATQVASVRISPFDSLSSLREAIQASMISPAKSFGYSDRAAFIFSYADGVPIDWAQEERMVIGDIVATSPLCLSPGTRPGPEKKLICLRDCGLQEEAAGSDGTGEVKPRWKLLLDASCENGVSLQNANGIYTHGHMLTAPFVCFV